MDWTLFASLSAFAVAIVGANYKFTRDITNDIKAELRKDIEAFEKRMEKSDERWVALLSSMHSIDKDVHWLKEKIK